MLMGVDFIAYSSVVIKPIPTKYRSTLKERSSNAFARELEEKSFQALRDGVDMTIRQMISLCKGLHGIGYDQFTGKEVMPPEIVHEDPALRNEFEELCEENDDHIVILWEQNMVYEKTAETLSHGCGRSYSGYYEFRQELTKLNGGKPLAYLPPDTDVAPENGVVTADKAKICLAELDKLKHHFANNGNEHSWFFGDFYKCIATAADCGILRIC